MCISVLQRICIQKLLTPKINDETEIESEPTSIRPSETIPVVGPQKIYKSKFFGAPNFTWVVGCGCSPFFIPQDID